MPTTMLYAPAPTIAAALRAWLAYGLSDTVTRAAMRASFIRAPGALSWPSAELAGFNWCGAFCAHALGRAEDRDGLVGGGLDESIRKSRLPSTYRLYAADNSADGRRYGPGLARRADPNDTRPGDVLVVGTNNTVAPTYKVWGEHICINIGPLNDTPLLITIEGNARGLLSNGTIGHGVIYRTRPIGKQYINTVCPITKLKQDKYVRFVYGPEV